MNELPIGLQNQRVEVKVEVKKEISDLIKNLTKSEDRIFKQIVLGWTARKISENLSLSISTVKFHTTNILWKTDCKRKAELIAKFYQEKQR